MAVKANKITPEQKEPPYNWFVKEKGPYKAICESDRGDVRELTYSEVFEDPSEIYDENGNVAIPDEDILRALIMTTRDDPELNSQYTGDVIRSRYAFDPQYLKDIEEYGKEPDHAPLKVRATKLKFVNQDEVIIEKDHDEVYNIWMESRKNQELGLDGI